MKRKDRRGKKIERGTKRGKEEECNKRSKKLEYFDDEDEYTATDSIRRPLPITRLDPVSLFYSKRGEGNYLSRHFVFLN